MIDSILRYTFLQHAIIGTLLTSIVCGIIGVIIIEKKLILMSGGIAHTAYGGVGLGYLLNFNPMFGAIGFSLLAAFSIGTVSRKGGKYSDIIIALFWSLGMALGIIFIALMPGYPPDINSYLFGNILSIKKDDLIGMTVLTLLILLITMTFFNDLKAYLFDQEFVSILGFNTKFFDNLLYILIALSVVVLIRISGIIMLIAMLCAPSATATLITNNLKKRMFLSAIIGELNCLIGLFISYTLDIASSATIVILSIIVFLITVIIKKLRTIGKF